MATAGEVFHFLAYAWDVSAGLKLAEGKPVVQADVSGWFPLLGLIGIDPEHAAGADVSKPLLVVRHPEVKFVLVDGWHRLHKAHGQGISVLPAVVLSEDEERQIRIHGGRGR